MAPTSIARGTIPPELVADLDREHPLTADVPRRPGRWYWRDLVARLDPVADAAEIHRVTATLEFPWDYQRALEFALFRTYCVPSISALLSETGRFRDAPQKRYDDTALLMSELVQHGCDSPRGREALRVINRQHAPYAIDDDDMLYVLSTFVFDPLDWIDSHGWRRLHPHERLAAFHFYRGVGERMGIRGIPDDMAEFRRWRELYEGRTFRYDRTNAEIGTYTVDLLCSWYPAPLRPAVRAAVLALIDDDMDRAFGFRRPPAVVRAGARLALRARSAVVRRLPVRREALGTRPVANRTYPGYPVGYRPADLGACPIPHGRGS